MSVKVTLDPESPDIYFAAQWIDAAACGAAIISDSLTAGVLIMALKRPQTPYMKSARVKLVLCG